MSASKPFKSTVPSVEPIDPKLLRPEILLHPNIPKPLHGLAPRTIMGEAWWDAERQKAYAKLDYHCWVCGTHKSEAKFHNWLEAHEFYEIDYAKGSMVFKETVALCHACHNFIHSGRMIAMVDQGTMTRRKQQEILAHGEAILKKHRLHTPSAPLTCAKWGAWRLVLDGKKYKGNFKTFEDWMKAYNRGK